jgi:hypothetical protein
MSWSFLSHHGESLLALARSPDLRLRDLASAVGVTARSAQSIVNDLVEAGYLERRREGRRNRYLVRGDRPLPPSVGADHVVADLVVALVSDPSVRAPNPGRRHALVLACSDHRYQEPLRNLMASAGLLREAEVVLWPGGVASLSGPEGSLMLEVMHAAVGTERPKRLVLVAHDGCHVRGAFRPSPQDPFAGARDVNRRRRQTIALARDVLGVTPELWYLTNRRAHLIGGAKPASKEELSA